MQTLKSVLPVSQDRQSLQKMREVIKLNHVDIDRTELGKQSIPLLKNPRLLAEHYHSFGM